MARVKSTLKKGDPVMVIAGGNQHKRPIVGKVGKIKEFTGDDLDRVVVEGLNLFVRHQRATGPDKPGGKRMVERSIHISNVMYYVEKLKKPVRLRYSFLADGKKVRGYKDPSSKQFVQIEG